MAVYAIGDIQGCYDSFRRLLDRLNFDPEYDRLWLTGDLVNRGSRSLDVLRYVARLGTAVVTVLGNHDLHLLASAAGVRALRHSDSFGDVLASRDRDALLHWLRRQKLMHHDETLNRTLVHAGLPPQWNLQTALRCAIEAQDVLASDTGDEFFAVMYGDEPKRWDPELTGNERLRFIINAFTRIRYCTVNGALDLNEKGAPATQNPELIPWYEFPGRWNADLRLVFGHWSTLPTVTTDNLLSLDGGCVWGGELCAVQLDVEPPERVNISCPQTMQPGEE